jgi:hypothetical protein
VFDTVFNFFFESQILLDDHPIIWVNLMPISVDEAIVWIEISLEIIFGLLNKLMSLVLFGLHLFHLLFCFLLSLFLLINAAIEDITWFCLLFSQSEIFDLFLFWLLLSWSWR